MEPARPGALRRRIIALVVTGALVCLLTGSYLLLRRYNNHRRFLGTWICHTVPGTWSRANMLVKDDGTAYMTFFYRADGTLVTTPLTMHEFHWSNNANLLTFTPVTNYAKPFQSLWTVSEDGKSITLTGLSQKGQYGYPLVFLNNPGDFPPLSNN